MPHQPAPDPSNPTGWLQNAFNQTVKIESLQRTAAKNGLSPQAAAKMIIKQKNNKMTAEEEGELDEAISNADLAALVHMIDNYQNMNMRAARTVSFLNSLD